MFVFDFISTQTVRSFYAYIGPKWK